MATERETINTSGDYGATETGIGTDVGAGGGDDVGNTGPATGTTAGGTGTDAGSIGDVPSGKSFGPGEASGSEAGRDEGGTGGTGT